MAQPLPGDTVHLQVDLQKKVGPLYPMWSWFGYDEPNYTYMPNGKKLLTELAQLSKTPVYVRTHSLLVTGSGEARLKWGSTNAYTENEKGEPVYNWTILDSIMDTYIQRGMHPYAQISFMPKALSTHPEPYEHHWGPEQHYGTIFTGWAYPPTDYKKFAALVYEWVTHAIQRYGKEEVEQWYWEVWNEPDIDYWKGTTAEYIKLYDYAADAVKRALPTAKVGGPETTGPGSERAALFLTTFLDHIVSGQNAVTGKKGASLDFISFHAKGQPQLVNGTVQMNMGKQLRDIDKGFAIVAAYPTLKDLPIIIGESDPEGCAACSEDLNPQNAYRNGTMYSSYTAASFARVYDLAASRQVQLKAAVTWAFEFEGQPWFRGFRDLATNGVDKPVLNIFRMFGLMQGDRVAVSGGTGYDYRSIRDSSVRKAVADINGLAAAGAHTATVMIWNYHDLNITNMPAAPLTITIKGLPATKVLLQHYRIDGEHSNAYEAWKKMSSPQQPTPAQVKELEAAGQLALLSSPQWVKVSDNTLQLSFSLPRQGVSLLKLEW